MWTPPQRAHELNQRRGNKNNLWVLSNEKLQAIQLLFTKFPQLMIPRTRLKMLLQNSAEACILIDSGNHEHNILSKIVFSRFLYQTVKNVNREASLSKEKNLAVWLTHGQLKQYLFGENAIQLSKIWTSSCKSCTNRFLFDLKHEVPPSANLTA